MAFDLRSLVGSTEHQTAPKQMDFTVHNIAITDIVPSSKNFYGIRDIEELADNIEENGLLHNLVVRAANDAGEFEIVSGERRYRACKLLYDAGNMNYASLPCTIKDTQNDLVAELQLIGGNKQRDKTDYERTMEITRTKEILLALQKEGYKFSGRMRARLAEMFDVSPAQIGRAEKIDKDLAPELKEGFKDGKIGITTAYDLATLPADQQAEAVKELEETGSVSLPKPKKQKAAPQTACADLPIFTGAIKPGDYLHECGRELTFDEIAQRVGSIIAYDSCYGDEFSGSALKAVYIEKVMDTEDGRVLCYYNGQFSRLTNEKSFSIPEGGGSRTAAFELPDADAPALEAAADTRGMTEYMFNNDKDRRDFLDTYEQWGVWVMVPQLAVRYYRCELPNGLQIIVEKQDDTTHSRNGYEWTVNHERYHVMRGVNYTGAHADLPDHYAIESGGITEIMTYMEKPKGKVRILNAYELAARDAQP